MISINALGFIEGVTVEVIASTYTERRQPTAAPMGATLTRNDSQLILLRPFLSTQTYQNLSHHKAAVLNIVNDPLLYLYCTFKELTPSKSLGRELFTHASSVDAPCLLSAEAHIEVEVAHVTMKAERAEVFCSVKRVGGNPSWPQVYSRARFALIESIIHATRIKEFHGKHRTRDVDGLLKLIVHYRDMIKRVAPDSRYSEAMDDLLGLISSWNLRI